MVSPRVLTLTGLYQLGVVALLTTVGIAFERSLGVSILVGGLFMAANFWALRKLSAGMVAGEGASKSLFAVMLGLKLVVAMGVLAFLLYKLQLNLVGFATGIATLFVGMGLAIVHVLADKEMT